MIHFMKREYKHYQRLDRKDKLLRNALNQRQQDLKMQSKD